MSSDGLSARLFVSRRLCATWMLPGAAAAAVAALLLTIGSAASDDARVPADVHSEIAYADALVHGPNMRAGRSSQPDRMIGLIATALESGEERMTRSPDPSSFGPLDPRP